MGHRINRPVLDLGARRVLAEVVVTLPVPGRSDWSGNKATAAIWTDVVQNAIDTRGAEGTFVGADACFKGVGWQRFVAVLAAWPEFEHSVSLSMVTDVRGTYILKASEAPLETVHSCLLLARTLTVTAPVSPNAARIVFAIDAAHKPPVFQAPHPH